MRTDHLEAYINDVVEASYRSLLINGVVSFVGISVIFIALLLIVAAMGKQNVYISKEISSRRFPIFYALGFVLLYIYGGYGVWAAWVRVLYFLFLILGLFLLYRLITYRKIGLYAIVLMWFPFMERLITEMYYLIRDYHSMSQYSVSHRESVYLLGSYMVVQNLVRYALMCVVTVCTVSYYIKRRYFFRDGAGIILENASSCPKCGKILVEEAKHCTYCGEKIEGRPWSQLNLNVLDEMKYCKNCGTKTSRGLCSACRQKQKTKEQSKT